MKRADDNGNPGAGGSHAGAKKGSDGINAGDATRFFSQSLSVDLIAADELAVIARFKDQLLGPPEPRVIVVLHLARSTVANEYNEPVAVCDIDGRLLAYRMPQ